MDLQHFNHHDTNLGPKIERESGIKPKQNKVKRF
jgi:hypothetical protein